MGCHHGGSWGVSRGEERQPTPRRQKLRTWTGNSSMSIGFARYPANPASASHAVFYSAGEGCLSGGQGRSAA